MAYDMLTVRRRRLNIVKLEAITTYSGSLFYNAITRTGKEFARTLIPAQSSSVFSVFNFSRLADIH